MKSVELHRNKTVEIMYNPLKTTHTELQVADLTETPAGYDTGWRQLPCTVCSYLHVPGKGPSPEIAVKVMREDVPDVLIPCGCVLLISSRVRHRIVTMGNGLFSAWMHFSATCGPGWDLTELFEFPIVYDAPEQIAMIADGLTRIIQLFRSTDPLAEIQANFGCASLTDLFLAAARPKRELPHQALCRLAPAIQAIRNHPERRYSSRELAELCFLSESRFRAVFHDVMGQTPHEFGTNERIHAAIRLLWSGLNLSEIAEQLAYCDTSHFSRDFRRATGIAPGNYRKTCFQGWNSAAARTNG